MDETSKEIGRLGGIIEGLRLQWETQDEEATQGRRVLHQAVESLRIEQATTNTKLEQLQKEMAKVKKPVEDYMADKNRLDGMKRMGGWLWAGLIPFIAAFGWIANELAHAFISKPPHP